MDNMHDRLVLAALCVVMLFPAGIVIVGLAGLVAAQNIRIFGEVPAVVYVALLAGLLFVGFGISALTTRTPARSRLLGMLGLVAFVTCISTGTVALHMMDDACAVSDWTGYGCSGD